MLLWPGTYMLSFVHTHLSPEPSSQAEFVNSLNQTIHVLSLVQAWSGICDAQCGIKWNGINMVEIKVTQAWRPELWTAFSNVETDVLRAFSKKVLIASLVP